MKKILLAAAALAFTASAAAAADAPGCSDQWSGAYIGLHGGYAFGDTDTVGTTPNSLGDVDISGFLGGGLAGYNIQNCDWVFGLEGDFGLGEVDGSGGAFTGDDIDLEPNGHLRGRLGMVWNNDILLFAAAGVAIADIDATIPGVGNDSNTHFGLSGGVGVDFMVNPNWLIRAEYLLDFYGSETYNYPGGNVDIDAMVNTVRAAVIYKF